MVRIQPEVQGEFMQKITNYLILNMLLTDAFTHEIYENGDQELLNKFEVKIQTYIDLEWQPHGEPFIILDNRWQQINQVMVKYE